MSNAADEVSQRERLAVLENDRKVRVASYHSIAMAEVDDTRGGRYATSDSKATVVGATQIRYPAQPAGSPWHCDPCPTEPSLGYSVDEQEPVGEMFERAAPASQVAAAGVDGGSISDGTSEIRPAKFHRRS
jgi:hypothetical protein